MASEQQELITKEINTNVVSINNKTHENFSATYQKPKAGDKLAELSVSSQKLVSKLKVA